jgi:hypothetical protein
LLKKWYITTKQSLWAIMSRRRPTFVIIVITQFTTDLFPPKQHCPPLTELFTIGQSVVCSIVEIKKDGNVLAVNASLDPALVNKERSHHFIRAGHALGKHLISTLIR